MKLQSREAVEPQGFYIGLRDCTGTKSVANYVWGRVNEDKVKMLTGVFTSKDGKQYKEKSIYTESINEDTCIEILRISNQESALEVDTHGQHWFLYPDGSKEYAGTMVMYTSEPDGDYSTNNRGLYWKLI